MIRNLLRKARIPKSLFPAVFSALKVIREIRFDCCRTDRKTFAHKVVERIFTMKRKRKHVSLISVMMLNSNVKVVK